MISVVIPTHNRPEGLRSAILSVFNQTVLPDEVLVIDDGSTLPVDFSVFAGAPKFLQCIILRDETAKGANNARNRGVLEASGDYIAFLDDDDQFAVNKIEVVSEVLTSGIQPDVIYHPAKINMVNESISYTSSPKSFCLSDDVFRELLVSNKIGGTSMAVVRKQALVDVGLFDIELPALQDYELWLRLAKGGKSFYYLSNPLTEYFHTTKKTSVSKSLEANHEALVYIECKYSDAFLGLSSKEKKAYEIWKRKMMIHKSLLNGKAAKAVAEQFKLLCFAPGVVNLIALFAVLLGSRFVFKLKALMSK